MKDRPILFNAEMVRAILEGRKVQTRRVMKPQPVAAPVYYEGGGWTWNLSKPKSLAASDGIFQVAMAKHSPYGQPGDQRGTKFRDSSPPNDGWYWTRWATYGNEKLVWLRRFHSPEDEARGGVPDNDVERWLWGVSPQDDPESVCLDVAEPLDIEWRRPGDRLWVRETWQMEYFIGPNTHPGGTIYIQYKTTPEQGRFLNAQSIDKIPQKKSGWRPSIHMPRWASRITLEITGIRVERVQDISREDALAEGVGVKGVQRALGTNYIHATDIFRALWDSINAKRGYSWEQNPWVWVVEFKLINCLFD